ncbi:DUF2530 domain-containing protein [Agromyces seonyuensis]|uniref:DUF2530 domain-containing protein n=1 Tax=Agromyces seonyuensis TaxID=2662446 RepID=A0A6I4P2I7_9MICO|nr:DUF2530 domain-containing protein [Agromyces seonyuensis]MWB97507.1 DUF2530 domain-containing protein [Agromyces seonyuensis]
MGFLDVDGTRRPAPEPARVDVRVPVAVGTLLWMLAATVAGFAYGPLDADGLGWWLTAAIVGVVLGFVGLAVLLLRSER